MKKVFLVIFLLIVLLPITSSATVDAFAVNHITKDYYWANESGVGWVGWNYVPEGQLDTAEDDYIKLGYQRTYYPYKIESAIALTVIILLLITFYIIRNKKTTYNNAITNHHKTII